MIKTFKKLFIVFTAFCLLLASVAFSACKDKDGDPSKDGYTVTVLYPDGSPVKAADSGNSRLPVSVILLGNDGYPVKDENGTEISYVNPDSEGKAHFDYKIPGEYAIKIINLPAGYIYDETAKTSAKATDTTVNLTLQVCAYDITVNLPDGSPAAGIGVKLMKGREQIAEMTTNAQGKAVSPQINASVYDIILSVSDSYGYKPVQTSMSGAAIVINLFDLHEIDLQDGNKMTPEQENEWAEALNKGGINRFDTEFTHYLYTAEMKGNEEIFYVFKVEKAGTYTINVKGDTNYEMKFYPSNLKDYEDSLTISGDTNSGNNVQVLSLKPGETFYVSVCSLDGNSHTTQFAVAFNIDPDTKTVSAAGTYNLSFELNYAILKFKPTTQGKYSIGTNSELYDTKLVVYSDATGKPIFDEENNEAGNDDKSADDKNFYYIEDIDDDHIGNTYVYRIYIKNTGVKFPVNLNVIITREGNATPPRETITRNVTTTNTVQFADQSGTLTAAPCNGDLVPYEKEGLWYVSVDDVERKLVVYITKNIPGVDYSFTTIEYMGEYGKDEELQNSYLTVYEDLDDYHDQTATTPLYKANYRGFIESYAAICNKDGVYEVNEELHLFLTRYMNQRGKGIEEYTGTNVAEGYYWLLACGYYA